MGILDSFYANPVQFANEVGLYALLSIIPLIIIYLLRPRPKKIKIPSLMFLLDIEKKKRRNGHIVKIKETCIRMGADFHSITTDIPVFDAIFEVVNRRV